MLPRLLKRSHGTCWLSIGLDIYFYHSTTLYWCSVVIDLSSPKERNASQGQESCLIYFFWLKSLTKNLVHKTLSVNAFRTEWYYQPKFKYIVYFRCRAGQWTEEEFIFLAIGTRNMTPKLTAILLFLCFLKTYLCGTQMKGN